MSLTVSTAANGMGYWTYMAAVLVESLEHVIRLKRLPANAVPKGVFSDAQEFFRLAVQGSAGIGSEDPTASLNAYLIVADVVRESSPKLRKHDDIETSLEEWADFAKTLRKPRSLNNKELQLARTLREFFRQLQEEGEAEAYERRFERGAPPIRLAT